MPKILTHDEFVKRVIDIHGDSYEFLTKYINAKTKIRTIHKECEYEWDADAYKLISKKRNEKIYCPNCNGGISYDLEKVKQLVFELTGNEYVIISDVYTNAHQKIKMRHNIPNCMHEYYVTHNNFKHGHRCPKCNGSFKKTTQEFKEEVYALVGEEYEVLDEYISNKTKLRIKHISCENVWLVKPSHFTFDGVRCPFCSSKTSKGEIKIMEWLNSNNFKHLPQYSFENCKLNKSLLFDFVVFNENEVIKCLIEFDGGQHFEPIEWFGGIKSFELTKIRDQIKNEYCKDNNIPLLRIPYWEFDNIESILEEFLFNIK